MTNIVNKRYQLHELIEYERMTTVYRGYDLQMKRTVAIQTLNEGCCADQACVACFQSEAKVAVSLRHPNIVHIFDYGRSDDTYFRVTELVDGIKLCDHLRSHGILAVDQAIVIARDIALGLGAAHLQGVIHRDVKPRHILISHAGHSKQFIAADLSGSSPIHRGSVGRLNCKLANFGIARLYQYNNDREVSDWPEDSAYYCAPEQARGDVASPASDVYALGIVIYEMLTGHPPFLAEKNPIAIVLKHMQELPTPPSRLNPNIPPLLEKIVLLCLEKHPERRFRNGNALAHALAEKGVEK